MRYTAILSWLLINGPLLGKCRATPVNLERPRVKNEYGDFNAALPSRRSLVHSRRQDTPDYNEIFKDHPVNDIKCDRIRGEDGITMEDAKSAAQYLQDTFVNTRQVFDTGSGGCTPVFCYTGNIAVELCNDREAPEENPVVINKYDVGRMVGEIVTKWEADNVWLGLSEEDRSPYSRPCFSVGGLDAGHRLTSGTSGPYEDPWKVKLSWVPEGIHGEECVPEDTASHKPEGGEMFGEPSKPKDQRKKRQEEPPDDPTPPEFLPIADRHQKWISPPEGPHQYYKCDRRPDGIYGVSTFHMVEAARYLMYQLQEDQLAFWSKGARECVPVFCHHPFTLVSMCNRRANAIDNPVRIWGNGVGHMVWELAKFTWLDSEWLRGTWQGNRPCQEGDSHENTDAGTGNFVGSTGWTEDQWEVHVTRSECVAMGERDVTTGNGSAPNEFPSEFYDWVPPY
ncbi:hypothetical protein ABW19_dt0206832 [Dactylella cylindrospora]|nr:hypothetical protein ABW19_dt0206832 [Dactylella cylindrospora]